MVGGTRGPLNPEFLNLDFAGHVDVVAEADGETSDSARAPTSPSSLRYLPLDAPAILEFDFLQNVIAEETPKHARHPTSGPS